MKEPQAKRQLRNLLRHFTPGSLLHLLADLFREDAAIATQGEDTVAYDRCKHLEHTLYVVGLALDAANPR